MSQASNPQSDRNLLFGILALQLNFMTRDDLVAGMNRWVLEKSKSLGQILLEEKRLSSEQVQALESLLLQHLKAHDDNAERSLRAITVTSTVASDLTPIDDGDLNCSISYVRNKGEQDASTRDYPRPSEGTRFRRGLMHAEGGQGIVYFADDTELHREVALKELKPKFADDAERRLRFMREAEITGGMEHPGIVPVYSLGAYKDGRPFYAMKFIRGDNLKEAIARFHAGDQKPGRDVGERSLALRQLLRHFIDVCNAVAYAHSRGVLHRDLKPANIVLGKFGETLVIDWGLAKAGGVTLDAPATLAGEPRLQPKSSINLDETEPGFQGTVAYASPEQAAGRLDLMDRTSDIYSLGSTFYSLLTGDQPYHGKVAGDTLAKVRRGEFKSPCEVKPGTPPALDAICRKAMALEPKDRYRTALEFAADIEHWLADEPVSAYADPWTARVGRWSRRHRAAVVGAAVFLVSATVGLAIIAAVAVAGERATEKQRGIAEQNYQFARDLSFNSLELLQSSEATFASKPTLHATRREILKSALKTCKSDLEKQPRSRELRTRAGQINRFLANVHRLSDETDDAEAYYRDSLQFWMDLHEEFPEDPIYSLQHAETRRDEASNKVKQGRLGEASKALRAVSDELANLSNKHNDRLYFRFAAAAAMLDRASVEYAQGDKIAASKWAIHVRGEFDALLKLQQHEIHPYASLLQAATLNLIAITERDAGKMKEARAAHTIALKLLKDLAETHPYQVSVTDINSFAAICRVEQARTFARVQGKLADAENNLEGAIQRRQILATNYPWIPMYRHMQAEGLLARAEIRQEARRIAEAQGDYEQALTLLLGLVQKCPKIPAYQGDLGRSYAGLARCARSRGEVVAATKLYGQAIEAMEKAMELSPEQLQNRKSLADIQVERNQ